MRRVRLAAAALTVALVAAAPARADYAPRIIGGGSVSIDAFPFQVALVSNPDDPEIGQFCGGSVRDTTHVITAAHCVTDGFTVASPSEIDVFAGATDLDDPSAQRVHVTGVSFMPGYDPDNNDRDAALLTLAQPLVASQTVQPIELIGTDQGSFWEPGDFATVSGWGNTAPNGQPDYPIDLHAVQVPIVADAPCDFDYRHFGGIVDADMVCAGDTVDGGEDSCQGDSGGPLIVDTSPSSRRLIGIVSFGNGCADKDYPGVYTEVASAPIRSYLTAAPPPAPVNQTAPTVTGTPKEGQTLTCNAGTWTNSPSFRYQFAILNSASDTVPIRTSATSTNSAYIPSAADAGKFVGCTVEATNGGGQTQASSARVGPVEALPPAPAQPEPTPTQAPTSPVNQIVPLPQFDTTRPVSRLFRAKCGKTSCRLNIAVTDAGYSLGLRTLEGTVRTSYRARCRRGGRIVHCTRIRKRNLAIQAIPGGHFIASAKGLPRGTHTFRFVAVDTAGNRQSPALSVRRHTPPLPRR